MHNFSLVKLSRVCLKKQTKIKNSNSTYRYITELHTYVFLKTNTRMFITAQIKLGLNLKLLKYQSIVEWIK